MRKTTTTILLTLVFIFSNLACARGRSMSLLDPEGAQPDAQPAQAAAQARSFVNVEGADLGAKLADAARRARAAAPQTPFWTAYAFDVRPGVAVDPGGGEFHGSMNTVGGIHVFHGTRGGVSVETRNLGVFVLRRPGSDAVQRLEIYNLDRTREYSGHPVYWAGRAMNEESLTFLRGLLSSARTDSMLPERATLAIALHDDARVASILKELVRGSQTMKIRAVSVHWLGQTGGETAFLADLVRAEREPAQLRKAAAHAIGASRDQEALSTLQSLYASTATPREVRRAIIHAVGENENRAAASAFLLKVAQSDPDRDSRKLAIHQFGETGQESAIDDLMRLFAAEQDREVKKQVLHALSEIQGPRAEAKLFEIARTAPEVELRKQAVHWIGERDTETAVDELMKIYSSDASVEIKRQVLHAFSEMKSQRAGAKLLAVARDPQEPREARKQAIHWLGERDSEATVDELWRIFESDREVRQQILHAFSEMENQRAEDRLFEVARRADFGEVRKQAIHWLGEKASRRSLELLRDVVNSTDEQTEVQMQALHAISERKEAEAVPLLINVARTHPNQQVRRAAIHWLGESGDPRAVEFFKEILSKQ